MNTQEPQNSQYYQQGAALIIGLIFLVVMSIIGLSSMRNVSVQEQVNGNIVNKKHALQEAESALRQAEKATLPGVFAYPDYLLMVIDDPSLAMTDAQLLDAANWDCGKNNIDWKKRCIQLQGAGIGPMIKFEYINQEDDFFRITVRSVDKGNTVVTIQSVFKR